MRPAAHFTPWDATALLADFEATLGLPPAVFAPYRFWQRTPKGSIWLAAADAAPPPVPVDALGLLILREPPPRGRPTSVFALRFGHLATRGLIELTPTLLAAALAGQPFEVEGEPGEGWRLLRWQGRALGWGWLREHTLRPELPADWLTDLDPTTAD